MIKYRPCGACRALVPAHEGCTHWRPCVSKAMRDQSGITPEERERRRAEAETRKAQRKRAKERAERAVQEFRRQQSLGVRG